MTGGGQIITGDCAAVMDGLDPGSVDMVLTSPPYDALRDYHGYEFDFDRIAAGLYHVLKEGGVAVWVVGDQINGGWSGTSFEQALRFKQIGFRLHDVMIYEKINTPFQRGNAYTPSYELMLVLSKGAPKTFHPLKERTQRQGRETAVYGKGADGDNSKRRAVELGEWKVRGNIWRYAVGQGGTTKDAYAFQHPAMFPEKLARDHIESWTNPGDLVLDPMCGAGTTPKMAKRLGRRWLGIEISPEYAALARQRVAAQTESLF